MRQQTNSSKHGRKLDKPLIHKVKQNKLADGFADDLDARQEQHEANGFDRASENSDDNEVYKIVHDDADDAFVEAQNQPNAL